ncbi:MAG: AEC family transporter [Candidatus Omnitrophica bacterium]|nr:AEC family transporter [Candidatus Omnitrophota bacterium]
MIVATMAKLCILVVAGYVIYHRKIVNDKFVDMLSQLLIRVIFPCLIVNKTILNFSFSEYENWWLLPVCALLFSLFGMLLGALVLRSFKAPRPEKEFLCAAGFQNCGYLPMNIILFAFSGLLRDRLLVYTFLFIIGFNLLMWSLVPLFLSGKLKDSFKPKVLLNPPVIATVLSILWVAVFGKGNMPSIVMEPIGQLGHAAFPLAMLTLGAYLCRYSAHLPDRRTPVIAGMLVKLLIFPLIVLCVLLLVPLESSLRFFLFLQAIMPTAVSLIVIGAYTNADNKFLSSIILYTHVAAVFSIPLWLEVYRIVFRT